MDRIVPNHKTMQYYQMKKDNYSGISLTVMQATRLLWEYSAQMCCLWENSPYGGLFPVCSRINHSCRPNVHHFWDEEAKTENIYAIRDIAEGEEILTSYLYPVFKTREERRRELQRKLRFVCNCSV